MLGGAPLQRDHRAALVLAVLVPAVPIPELEEEALDSVRPLEGEGATVGDADAELLRLRPHAMAGPRLHRVVQGGEELRRGEGFLGLLVQGGLHD
jgi:hypothetical protein